MQQRKRHDSVDDFSNTVTCAVCETEFDVHSGDAREYYRKTSNRPGVQTVSLCLCENCEADFRCEHTNLDQPWPDDTLEDSFFDTLERWADKERVICFTMKENQPKTICDVEAFFDALSALLVWHPDSKFEEYQWADDAYHSATAHESSPNGCHPDCAACADEENHRRMFTPEEANDLDALMDKCIGIIELKADKNVYDYAIEAEVRAGKLPKEAEHQTSTPQVAQPPSGQPVTEEEMTKENVGIPEGVKLVIEASRLIADDVNEESAEWRAKADKFISGLTLANSSSAQVVILAETEEVLMFQSREGLSVALEWNDRPANQDGGNLTEYLQERNVRFIKLPGAVFFSTR